MIRCFRDYGKIGDWTIVCKIFFVKSFFRSSETIENVSRDRKIPVKRERLIILFVVGETDIEMGLRIQE